MSPDDFPSPPTRVDGPMDDFMTLGNDFVHQDPSYQDLLVWPDYPLELEMYQSPMHMGRNDVAAMAPFAADLSDISSNSEPMATPSTRGSIHTRGTSILSTADFDNPMKPIDLSMVAPSDSSIPEFEVVIASEGAWPMARCNPPIYSGTCPRTAIVHLECLEQKSSRTAPGPCSSSTSRTSRTPATCPRSCRSPPGHVTRCSPSPRASCTRPSTSTAAASTPSRATTAPATATSSCCPPSKILEYFLRSYVHSLSVYYPLVVGGVVDPNEMLHNTRSSTLLVLLMIAQGAAAVPTAEARYLSAGLTETCRISLFDIIEKNVELSADPTALRCALLFTLLGSWGGDKWQMDIAMGQRGMYLSVRTPSHPNARAPLPKSTGSNRSLSLPRC